MLRKKKCKKKKNWTNRPKILFFPQVGKQTILSLYLINGPQPYNINGLDLMSRPKSPKFSIHHLKCSYIYLCTLPFRYFHLFLDDICMFILYKFWNIEDLEMLLNNKLNLRVHKPIWTLKHCTSKHTQIYIKLYFLLEDKFTVNLYPHQEWTWCHCIIYVK